MTTRHLRVPGAVSAQRILVDRGGLFVSVGFYLVVTSVLATLWRAAASAAPGNLVVGYSGIALTWYVVTSELTTCSLNIRLIEEIGDEIASGSIAVEMLRPVRVIGVRLASETGRGLARLVVLAPAGVLLALVAAGAPPNAAGLALAIPSLVLAIACNVACQHAVAAVAFWLRDARSSWFIYQKAVFIVGGMLLPLQVLPDGLRDVAFALPFMAMAYAPARLASGHVEPWLLLVQGAWLVVLVGLAAAAFGIGQRRLQVVGG